jgi:hypothetical protein
MARVFVFNGLGRDDLTLERREVIASPLVTRLTYRVVKRAPPSPSRLEERFHAYQLDRLV